MKKKIKIDVISDVVCPWCYIGKRRLEKAIEQVSSEYDFDITYHPFELNPYLPAAGVNQQEHLADKFGGPDRYEQITNHTTQVAAQEGLTFDFEKQQTIPNTRKAHALIQLAQLRGVQLPLTEAFFKAYFTDGIDLSKDENLITLAVQAGLDRTEVEGHLSNEQAQVHVSLAEQEVGKLGISGVPFYIVNSKYGISGAQASETFVQAFQEIGKEITADGAVCEVGDPNC